MEHNVVLGIDIGGTSVKLGLVQAEQGSGGPCIIARASIPTQPSDPAPILVQRVTKAAKSLAASVRGAGVVGVGVGCPGLIDPWRGTVRDLGAANLPQLSNCPLRERLADALEWPVEIQNDANAAVLGEWLFGPASRAAQNLVLLTLGTGVGGGIICDGHLLVGADNSAAELGHLKVEYTNAASCACGRRGCLEAYAGAAGIARIAGLAAAAYPPAARPVDSFNITSLAKAAGEGDPLARQVFHTVGLYLGRGIANLIDSFNPEKIVLGGGVSAALDFLRPGIEASLDEQVTCIPSRQCCVIERSMFPDDINLLGAAAVYLNASGGRRDEPAAALARSGAVRDHTFFMRRRDAIGSGLGPHDCR